MKQNIKTIGEEYYYYINRKTLLFLCRKINSIYYSERPIDNFIADIDFISAIKNSNNAIVYVAKKKMEILQKKIAEIDSKLSNISDKNQFNKMVYKLSELRENFETLEIFCEDDIYNTISKMQSISKGFSAKHGF